MMDTATAARVVAGRAVGANVRFTRVTTDSRKLMPGDLFVALAGERFDGHDFVPAALSQGAAAAMVSDKRVDVVDDGALIAVPDPLAALGALASHWRAQFDIPVAIVVGILFFVYAGDQVKNADPLPEGLTPMESLSYPSGRWQFARYGALAFAGFGVLMAMFPKGR